MYYNTTGFLGIQARGENFTTGLPFQKKHLTSIAKRAKVHKNRKRRRPTHMARFVNWAYSYYRYYEYSGNLLRP